MPVDGLEPFGPPSVCARVCEPGGVCAGTHTMRRAHRHGRTSGKVHIIRVNVTCGTLTSCSVYSTFIFLTLGWLSKEMVRLVFRLALFTILSNALARVRGTRFFFTPAGRYARGPDVRASARDESAIKLYLNFFFEAARVCVRPLPPAALF